MTEIPVEDETDPGDKPPRPGRKRPTFGRWVTIGIVVTIFAFLAVFALSVREDAPPSDDTRVELIPQPTATSGPSPLETPTPISSPPPTVPAPTPTVPAPTPTVATLPPATAPASPTAVVIPNAQRLDGGEFDGVQVWAQGLRNDVIQWVVVANESLVNEIQISGDIGQIVSRDNIAAITCITAEGGNCRTTGAGVDQPIGCTQVEQNVEIVVTSSATSARTIGAFRIPGCPEAPTEVSIAQTTSDFTVSWTMPPTAETAFVIRDGELIGPLIGESASYETIFGATHQIAVVACNSHGCSTSSPLSNFTIGRANVSIFLGPKSTGACWNRATLALANSDPETGCYDVLVSLEGFAGTQTVNCYSAGDGDDWQLFDSFDAKNGTHANCSHSMARNDVVVVVGGTIDGAKSQTLAVELPALLSNFLGPWPTN